VPGQRSPARDVGTRLFRCDERHEPIITRGRSAKAQSPCGDSPCSSATMLMILISGSWPRPAVS
jgi:hypothetical protein